jgi:hypothetical protein
MLVMPAIQECLKYATGSTSSLNTRCTSIRGSLTLAYVAGLLSCSQACRAASAHARNIVYVMKLSSEKRRLLMSRLTVMLITVKETSPFQSSAMVLER